MVKKISAPNVFFMHGVRLGGSALLAAALLAACGGGGSDAPTPDPVPTPDPTPVATLSAAQGIWQSAPGSATGTSAIVLPDGHLWAVNVMGSGASSVTQVLKATFSVQGAKYIANGKIYTLGGAASSSAVVDLPVSASVVEKNTLTVHVGPEAGMPPLTLSWQSRYDTSASLAGFAGEWNGTIGAGTVRWNIDPAGRIAGTRTTGCTYTGQLALRTERKAVVDTQLQEDCAGTRTQLAGVATLNPENGRLSMVMTTSDETQAVLLSLAR